MTSSDVALELRMDLLREAFAKHAAERGIDCSTRMLDDGSVQVDLKAGSCQLDYNPKWGWIVSRAHGATCYVTRFVNSVLEEIA